jgi:OOP family OmpA-OmpF porin
MKTYTRKSLLISFAVFVLLGLAGPASAHDASYVTNIDGKYVMDGHGHCVRTINWTMATADPACEPGLVKREAPKVVAAPPPEPAPAPAPMAAPPEPAQAPAPTVAETRKAAIIEKPVRLEGASFATGSSRLLKAAGSKLDVVVDAANQYPDIQLEVSGYTDNTGNADSNLALSQARADAVKAYLVGKGVASDRIRSKGYGADNPVADNKTAKGRAMNRRVEIKYTIKEEQKN